jgi:pilus assembly protein CpaF
MSNLSDKRIREMVSRALHLVVQLERLNDGTRRIVGVTEIVGMEGSIITTQDIFVFEQSTIDEQGRVRGRFRATGVRPRFMKTFERYGVTIPPDIFRFVMTI